MCTHIQDIQRKKKSSNVPDRSVKQRKSTLRFDVKIQLLKCNLALSKLPQNEPVGLDRGCNLFLSRQ